MTLHLICFFPLLVHKMGLECVERCSLGIFVVAVLSDFPGIVRHSKVKTRFSPTIKALRVKEEEREGRRKLG